MNYCLQYSCTSNPRDHALLSHPGDFFKFLQIYHQTVFHKIGFWTLDLTKFHVSYIAIF